VKVKPITKAVLYVLTIWRHGPHAITWGLYIDPRNGLVLKPIDLTVGR
jgi:hypothetical protein